MTIYKCLSCGQGGASAPGKTLAQSPAVYNCHTCGGVASMVPVEVVEKVRAMLAAPLPEPAFMEPGYETITHWMPLPASPLPAETAMTDCITIPLRTVVDGREWRLFTYEYPTPDGVFVGYLHALSMEHAAALVCDLRAGAELVGKMISVGEDNE